MSCGAPVLASGRGSLPEILGEAGRFFDPERVEELVCGLRETLSDDLLREQMSRRGLARSRRFTWERAARDAISIFEALGQR
jgi:glycosyltransferase involved in cell wall biosynthesis